MKSRAASCLAEVGPSFSHWPLPSKRTHLRHTPQFQAGSQELQHLISIHLRNTRVLQCHCHGHDQPFAARTVGGLLEGPGLRIVPEQSTSLWVVFPGGSCVVPGDMEVWHLWYGVPCMWCSHAVPAIS
jgi:hypothetical protein